MPGKDKNTIRKEVLKDLRTALYRGIDLTSNDPYKNTSEKELLNYLCVIQLQVAEMLFEMLATQQELNSKACNIIMILEEAQKREQERINKEFTDDMRNSPS